VALSRLAYPFSIDWLEANTYLHVTRVLDQQPLYLPPSYEFIPLLYTPLYYYISAAIAVGTGQVMLAMRLTSFAASLLACAMLYAICRTRRAGRPASIVAVGLFSGSYAISGYWFDIAKMDSLFLALLLAAYALASVRARRDKLVGALAGIVAFLACAAKQQALLAVFFVILALLLERRWGKALCLSIAFAVPLGSFILVMNATTAGWFWFYVYTIPAAHPLLPDVLRHDFWVTNVGANYPLLMAAMAIAAIVTGVWRRRGDLADPAVFMLTFVLPLSTISLLSMAHQWGWINNLMPLSAAMAGAGAMAYQQVATRMARADPPSRALTSGYGLVVSLILTQFIWMSYDPRPQLPSSANLAAGDHMLAVLHAARGPIFIPTSPYLLAMVGQPTHFQASSLGDLSLASQHSSAVLERSKAAQDEIAAYLMSKSIQTAILPNATWFDQVFSPANGYSCTSLVADRPPLITLTGGVSYLDRICRYVGHTAGR
jgi:hypothetical protein